MELVDVWPLFGLRLLTPRLELRLVRDDDIAGLIECVHAGIHDPAAMPFAVPWTEAEPDELRRNFAQHQWRQRVQVRPDNWSLNFVVRLDGVPIGIQDMSAIDFAVLRTVVSASWLTRSRQGVGIGTEMRAALLLFAFDYLNAEVAESDAVSWNAASLGVSHRLGYARNGFTRVSARPGEVNEEVRLRLPKAEFVRPDWDLRVEGFDAARRDLVGEIKY
ncbi:GNAT family protein [Cryobacterium sp. CG_9.6]|uniref:GNAT family N-acetyltransferase n=1 Tax=Cryobacterium sp. CG_9.6 TaxID=2760710 RepID=UPI0024739B64|nr:GNAT family protein [Cryobacterium sp. CG_9.6]MDH6236422.1 RimJ/RimL family protein N-acetyltransferase [Cryobacterium sp. CG_9.6]